MASAARSSFRICKYCWRPSIDLMRSSVSSFSRKLLSTDAKTYPGLSEDSSWEADVLRHEKNLDMLKKQGVDVDDLPTLEREAKVQVLPHLSFRDHKKLETDESLLDISSKIILGNVTKAAQDFKEAHNKMELDPDFAREDVQAVLSRLHFRCNPEQVYKSAITKRKVMPRIRYFNDEQLKEQQRQFEETISEKIKMPPVMKERTPCDSVLSCDDILDGYEDSKVSFVDISEDMPHNRDRFIVVREPSGTLRNATWEERDRLLQLYFPLPGRRTVPLPLFKENNLKNAFRHRLHENLLDQCVNQFEPDSSDYIRVFEATYEDINKNKLYDTLRATRYYGGLMFYLVKKKLLDGILHDMIRKNLLQDAADAVHLYTLLHPDSKTKSAIQSLSEEDWESITKAYIQNDSNAIKRLSLALETINSTAAEDEVKNVIK